MMIKFLCIYLIIAFTFNIIYYHKYENKSLDDIYAELKTEKDKESFNELRTLLSDDGLKNRFIVGTVIISLFWPLSLLYSAVMFIHNLFAK